jgi:predicted GNAT superfamily acetyltransferase
LMGALTAMRTLEPTDLARRADALALAAAERSGVEIALVEETKGIVRVCDLFNEVWGTDADNAILPVGVLRAMQHAGNYAAGAYRDGEMVGAVVGFLGQDAWGPYLHSHILGVSANTQSRNVGFALKLHQRAWCLDIGITKVTWTFDPLVRRNAYFNLQKLGARASHYYENFYGAMTDDINAGDESDRVLIVWDLLDPRVERAAEGQLDEVDEASADVICETPPDIVALRKSDPDEALRWRRALRSTLGTSMNDTYDVTGFTRGGSYILRAADGDSHA